MDTPGSLCVNLRVSPASGWLWASVTVAVAVVIERPSARIVDGFNWRVMAPAGPALWTRVCWPGVGTPATDASIVVDPTVVELLNETLQLPLAVVSHDWAVGVTASPVAANETVSPDRGWSWASVTVAVAVAVAVPLARIVVGFNWRATLAAGPAICVTVAEAGGADDDVVSVAVTVVISPTVVELWSWTLQVPVVPVGSVVHDCSTNVAGWPVVELVLNEMVSPWTPPFASVAVAVSVTSDWPSATTVCWEGVKERLVAVPAACAADGRRQQTASATRALSRIVVRLLMWCRKQRRTAAAKRSLVLTRYPRVP
jgi:hypothetical protein